MKAIVDAPTPDTPKKLRSFLGLCGYFSKFIDMYATKVAPMRAVLQSNPFNWTPECTMYFEQIKKEIANSPALAMFDPNGDAFVTTDASDYGIAAVLSQRKDNQENTIAFASRTLTKAECNYSVIEKEALACVWAVEHWRTYLWGRKFTLKSDHRPLSVLFSSRGTGRASVRIARWASH